MNFVIDLACRRVSAAQWWHRSAESEVLRFDSSRGLRMSSLSHTRDKMKTSFFILIIVSRFVGYSFLMAAPNLSVEWGLSLLEYPDDICSCIS